MSGERLRLAGQTAPATLPLVGLASLTMRDINWLDAGFVPAGALTVVLGHGGIGKGPWTIQLAAKVTRSGGAVLFAVAEDDHESVLKPRLVAAGADMRLVDAIGELNSYKDHEVKRALKPLVALLERVQTTGIGVHHFAKDTSRGASFSGQASTAFRNTARSVLAMALHDQDDRARLVEVVKSNFATVGVGRLYRLELVSVPGVNTEQPVLIHEGDADKTVDEALQASATERAEVPRAKVQALVLRELQTGAKTRKHLDERARAELGVSADTLYKRGLTPLREQGAIRASKDGTTGGWSWVLA